MSRWITRLLQIVLPTIVLIHTALFILYWLTNSLFYSDTNDYMTNMLGARRDYISLCLWISALILLWSGARLVIFWMKIKHRLASLTAGLYVTVALIYLVFFYGSYWLLFRESPVQWLRIGQMVGYYRLILDPFFLLATTLIVGLLARRALLRGKATGRQSPLPILLPMLALIILWFGPLVMPPDSVYRGALPTKPLLIAHRGAAMLAPENTLASAKLAANLGVYGLETDVHISSDGKPFLLHDDTLIRTTDVEEVFPERAKDRAEYFSLAEVTHLNAGKWFMERDPFQTIGHGLVSESQMDEYAKQIIPTLADELQIVRQNQLTFIFDLKQPPAGQPYSQAFFDICLQEIQNAGIDDQVWFLVDQDQIAILRSVAPAMKPAYGVDYQQPPSVETLKTAGYQIVNAEYGLSKDWIRKYQQANLWVNLYTIDEPWQYSRLWLLGVQSTTSNNSHTMLRLDHPLLSLPFNQYLILWGCIGLLGLALLLGLTLPVYRRR